MEKLSRNLQRRSNRRARRCLGPAAPAVIPTRKGKGAASSRVPFCFYPRTPPSAIRPRRPSMIRRLPLRLPSVGKPETRRTSAWMTRPRFGQELASLSPCSVDISPAQLLAMPGSRHPSSRPVSSPKEKCTALWRVPADTSRLNTALSFLDPPPHCPPRLSPNPCQNSAEHGIRGCHDTPRNDETKTLGLSNHLPTMPTHDLSSSVISRSSPQIALGAQLRSVGRGSGKSPRFSPFALQCRNSMDSPVDSPAFIGRTLSTEPIVQPKAPRPRPRLDRLIEASPIRRAAVSGPLKRT